MPTGADEWLLDNFYIIEEQARQLAFKRGKKRAAFEIARNLIASGGVVTRTRIIERFAGKGLYDEDIWAIPQLLRRAILERIAELIRKKAKMEAVARSIAMGDAITSLRGLQSLNMRKIFGEISGVEKILAGDDVYARMTEESKDYYRKRVGEIGRRRRMNPFHVAREALDLAREKGRHVGYYLIDTELGRSLGRKKAVRRFGYAYVIALLVAAILPFARDWRVAALLFLPVLDMVVNLVNYFATRLTKPKFVPRMDFSVEKGGIPEEYLTYIVIPAMVNDVESGKELFANLEAFYLANRDDNLRFALIADSRNQDIMGELGQEAERLNGEYGSRFELFTREAAWERKRGALVEFARSVRGKAKYIITLDCDTILRIGVAAELVGAMAHPLNRPRISYAKGRVVRGYGIMQPRIVTDVRAANRTLFSKIFAGQGGVDCYSSAVSDVYQDLFDEGIFTGKGIFDVETFLKVLDNGVIKDNTVLSHDLLEGCYLRCALLGDVALVDGFPARYSAWMARGHRWIRGDWQLLPWLRRRMSLSGISKWKVIDNMRRSVTPIILSVMLAISIRWLPIVLLVLSLQLLISTIKWVFSSDIGGRKHLHSTVIYGLRGALYQVIFLFVTLPHSAYMALDAIIRTLWRVGISKKNLLQWTTAAESERGMRKSLWAEYRRMWVSVIFGGLLIYFGGNYLGALWVIAPIITWAMSKEKKRADLKISQEDEHILRQLARRTWQYYEDFVNEKTNWLVPDNYQENPPNGVAMRTSPTNIGMHMAAAISAYDFGFISQRKLVEILGRIMDSIDRMEKWNGNLYNWYDIGNLEPLHPKYVSSVDSGNFLCYVMVVIQGLRELQPNDMERGGEDLRRLAEGSVVWEKALVEHEEDAKRGSVREGELAELIARLEELVEGMRLAPMYDSEKDLFSIGYNAEKQELTESYYDLLASEARQASFIAIARGEIPLRNWERLGRTQVERDGYGGLISWTGSCFEYLMPLLIMKSVPNTLLDETYHFAIRMQRKYSKMRGLKVWGVSESGFNAFDNQLNYQYKAFGVPDLGVSRSILDDIVLAPYAGVMALQVDYKAAMANLRRMNDMGFCGTYGFYEAVDYTPNRVLQNNKHEVVKSYMAHHLGMAFLAINNVLNDNIMQERFGRIPHVRASEELLTERVPTNVVVSKENRQRLKPPRKIEREDLVLERTFTVDSEMRRMHVLGNERFTCVVDEHGGGFCRRGEILLNNRDIGDCVFVKNSRTGEVMRDYDNVLFAGDRAEFVRNGEDGLDVTKTIFVDSEINAKMTMMLFANNSDKDMKLEVLSYSEVVLAPEAEHYAHMAFSKLFAKVKQIDGALLFKRKGEMGLFGARMFVDGKEIEGDACSARGKVLGRCGNIKWDFEGDVVKVPLDPVACFKFDVIIPAGGAAKMIGVCGVSKTREEEDAMLARFSGWEALVTSLDMARSRARFEEKYLEIGVDVQNEAMENLDFAVRRFGQPFLWKLGISGDLPIFSHLVESEDMGRVEELLAMHRFLAFKGIRVDLALMVRVEGDYLQPIATAVRDLVRRENSGGNVHVLVGLMEREIDLVQRAGRIL